MNTGQVKSNLRRHYIKAQHLWLDEYFEGETKHSCVTKLGTLHDVCMNNILVITFIKQHQLIVPKLDR